MDANWGLNGEDEKTLWEDWDVDTNQDKKLMEEDVVAEEGHESENGRPPNMREVRSGAILKGRLQRKLSLLVEF